MFDQAMIANNFVYEEARFKDVMLTRIYDNVKFPTTVNDHEVRAMSTCLTSSAESLCSSLSGVFGLQATISHLTTTLCPLRTLMILHI